MTKAGYLCLFILLAAVGAFLLTGPQASKGTAQSKSPAADGEAAAVMPSGPQASPQQPPNLIQQPYLLDTGLVSRSISFENPTGAPGEGGKAASTLGVGRKGAAHRYVKPGETVQLADIEGPGTIRHIWMTIDQ